MSLFSPVMLGNNFSRINPLTTKKGFNPFGEKILFLGMG